MNKERASLKEEHLPQKVCKRNDLDALLRRKDVWRGYSQAFVAQQGIDTGFDNLNQSLLYKGWPEACLIECSQTSFAATWFLMAKATKQLLEERGGVMAVLNPPATPYAIGLLQMGIPTSQLIIVDATSKADFVACFVELSRSKACHMLMAWQPKENLNYTELRKCQLATTEQAGVYCLFRQARVLAHSSPAPLRIKLSLQVRSLILHFVKQRGSLPGRKVELDLPEAWFTEPAYSDLDISGIQSTSTLSSESDKHSKSFSVLPHTQPSSY